jgi:hypothetical protein
MKASELRIGNYYSDLSGVCTLKQSDFLNLDIEKIEPVLLTEQWLLDFGFKKRKNRYFFDDWIIVQIEDGNWDNPSLDFFIKRDFHKKKRYVTCVQYVHELQNLFYPVSGKELTIKKKV